MDIAGVQEALRHQPFEPFSLSLADGRKLPVKHPDFVAVHPRRIIVIPDDGCWSVVEPLLIASIDFSGPSDKGGNGAGRKKPKR